MDELKTVGSVMFGVVAVIAGLLGIIAYFLNGIVAAERARVTEACESRGGHMNEGMVGSHTFTVCVEPDGTMPNVPGLSETTVVPVVMPVSR